MIELIPSNTKIPFMKFRMPMFVFSAAITIFALYCIVVKGFNYGVDFAGGVQIVLTLPADSGGDSEKLRASLDHMGIKDASIQSFGGKDAQQGQFMVHFPAFFAQEDKILPALNKAFSSLGSGLVSHFRFVGLEKAYLTLSKDVPIADVEKTLRGVSTDLLQLVEVQKFGRDSSNEYQLTFKNISSLLQAQLNKNFVSPSGTEVKIEKVDFVGAKVGSDLRLAALLSFIVTIILVFLYIFIRFDIVYAPGVVLAMVHDVLIAAGVFALLGLEFDLTIVAALLTLAGYSINDTIIVYDRIREVAGNLKGKSFRDIIDIAANQTLSRTIITSGTVFLATLALWLFGGPVIHGFSVAFLIGIVVGTYSSVFIAAPTILWMDRWINGPGMRSKKSAAA